MIRFEASTGAMSLNLILALTLGATAAVAQDPASRSSVPQLTTAGSDIRPIGQDAAPADPAVGQLTSDETGRAVPTRERPSEESRRAPTIDPDTVSRGVRVSAPPPGAIDLCEAANAGRAEPPAGIDCASVLEAAAFSRQSPEERLLVDEEIAMPTDGALVSNGRVIPSASLVAQRLATGDLANSPVAQAVAAGFGARPADAAPPTTPDPNGPPSTIVIPPDGGQ